jgi:hypothetical protein
MGIVARNTSQALISVTPTAAVLQAIGLEADVHLTTPAVAHDEIPGAVTLTAEVGNLFGGELAKIGLYRRVLTLDGVEEMCRRASVAVLAVDPGFQSLGSET